MSEDVEPNEFRAALGHLASGVCILTSRDDQGHDVGMTVTSVMSASLVPPLVVVAVNAKASAYPALIERGAWGVSFLDGSASSVADAFAQHHTERTRSPFEMIPMRAASRIPALLLADALAAVECVTEDSLPLGDHVLLVGRVVAVVVRQGSPNGSHGRSGPLIRYSRQYGTFRTGS